MFCSELGPFQSFKALELLKGPDQAANGFNIMEIVQSNLPDLILERIRMINVTPSSSMARVLSATQETSELI